MAQLFHLKAVDNHNIFVRQWTIDQPKGVVQLVHGMNEHSERYTHFAKFLNKHGYNVYATDHRAHGYSALSIDKIGYLEDDGFSKMVQDEQLLFQHIQKTTPKIPHFILGHSMGSFITQRYIQLYGDQLTGAILVGSGGRRSDALIGAFVSSIFERLNGDKRSKTLENMIFKGYNTRFDNRTSFDWLAIETTVVDNYIKDPYCGHIFPPSFYRQFLTFLHMIFKDENIDKVPTTLPLSIFSGSNDPVGQFGKGVKKLYQQYNKRGFTNLKYIIYPEVRHEILNDRNHEVVYKDILSWLEIIFHQSNGGE